MQKRRGKRSNSLLQPTKAKLVDWPTSLHQNESFDAGTAPALCISG